MHRKVLISLAFAGTAAFLAAQALVRSPGQGAAGAPGGPGAGVTGPMAKRADTAFNAIQQVLHEYIVADTNHLIDVAQETGKDSTVSKMIESQCYHLLTLMDDAQRDHEINGVWQVKVWKPGGQWNHVTEAPKKAKAILNVSADQDKEIRAIHDKIRSAHMAKFHAITHRLASQGLSGQAHADAYRVELEKFWGGKPKSFRSRTFLDTIKKGAAPIRALLTSAQQAEWDSIVAGYSIDLKQAFEGSNDPPDSK